MKISVLLACLVFASPAWAQKPKIKEQQRLEAERNFLKENKIKIKSEYKVLLEGEEVLEKTLFRQETYDENGFLIQTIEPQPQDSIVTVYQYDNRGFEVMNTIIGMDLVPAQNSTEYDEQGRKTGGMSSSAESRKYSYIYDKNDNLIRAEGYTEDYESGEWALADIDSFFYDRAGNLIEEVSYYMGEEVWREKHMYDSQGRLVKTEGIRSENVELTEEYTYDQKGFLSEHTSTDSDGTLIFIYEYESF
jgi:YD repeat-containing protein